MQTAAEREEGIALWKTCFRIQDKAVPLLLRTLATESRPWLRDNCLILLSFYVTEADLPVLLKTLDRDESVPARPAVWIYEQLFVAAGGDNCIKAMMKLFYGETTGVYSRTVAANVLTKLLAA